MNLIKFTFYFLCFAIILISFIVGDKTTPLVVIGVIYIKYTISSNKKQKINSLTKKIKYV